MANRLSKVTKKLVGAIQAAYQRPASRVYVELYDRIAVDNQMVFYESRDGKAFTDSPYAFFVYLMKQPEYKNLKHIWVYDNERDLPDIKQNLVHVLDERVSFVKRNSVKYAISLLKAKYLFNNSTFQGWVSTKPEQVYVNTWHGTPLKKMGFDIADDPKGSQNVVRNFMMADYLVSPNAHVTNMFLSSYKLDGMYEGVILEGGYPRNDLTLNAANVVTNKLDDTNVLFDNAMQTLLYTPTYRGTRFDYPKDDLSQLRADVVQLHQQLGDKYNVLVKVHPFVYASVAKDEVLKPFLVPDAFDANEMLSIVDVLVTDYSSIFFDYLVTQKPIIFYIPDQDEYEGDRGLYFDTNQLPGIVETTIDGIVAATQNLDSLWAELKPARHAMQEMVAYDDGIVTERYVNRIFKNIADEKIVEVKAQRKERKLLFYPGGMLSNGITTSIINLMKSLDFSQYDVTFMMAGAQSDEVLENLRRLPQEVRIMYRFGKNSFKVMEYVQNFIVKHWPLSKVAQKLYPATGFTRETSRAFPKMPFDVAVDFSGYSMFGARYMLHSGAKKKIAYLHNDMMADGNRVIDGKRPLFRNVQTMMGVYHRFDVLVNPSQAVKAINEEKLQAFTRPGQMTVVENLLDLERIHQQPANETREDISHWVDRSRYTFATVARFSPEKNQLALVQGFADVVDKHPTARLLLIGYGPLQSEIEELIKRLNLADNVYVVGKLNYPYDLLREVDAFVFPSLWEGQGIALLEALTLGLPVVASDISTSREILGDDEYGLLAHGTSADALGRSMGEILENKPVFKTFNANSYNADAIVKTKELFSIDL